ncbi:hypothetical protein MMC10_009775 [Thelotrema lepadinum]|nr:hypothetical protein [Thelotrema lepadinum]
MNDSRNYRHYPKQAHNDRPMYSMPAAAPPPRPPKVLWPPSPSVEDEHVSLSRETTPSLPELENSNEVKMRGSIDQQPILLEIGKDDEVSAGEASSKKQKGKKKKKGVRFEPNSSDESSGPPTPVDASPLKDDHFHRPRSQPRRDSREPTVDRRGNIPLASPSLQDVISNTVRPRRAVSQVDRLREEDARLQAERMKKPKESAPKTYSSEVRKHANGREYFGSHEAIPEEQHYPGTLDELKHRRQGDSKGHAPHLPFAERHRTMSGSSDSADHRPMNMRHMSAMGYSGEGKTPSFARDHPAHLHSPPPDPRNAPAFRTPRPHRRDLAVETDSDSEISPDEAPRKEKRSSRILSKPDGPEPSGRSSKHDYPLRPPPEQTAPHQRPITPIEHRQQQPSRPLPDRLKSQDPRDLPVKASRSPRPSPLNSPSGSPRNSIHGTPPQSPRPGSKDDFPSKESSPTITKPHRISRAASPSLSIPLYPIVPQLKCTDEQHHHNHHPSRASSPTLHPPNDVNPERQSRDTNRQTDVPRSRRSTSPLPAPTPSRTLRPDLKIDIQTPTPEPPMKTWNGPRPGLASRPVSGDFSSAAIAYSPKPPASAPLWAAEHNDRGQRQQDQYAPPPMAQLTQPQSRYKPRGPPSSLPPCSRPGFVTGYNDWWTLRNAPDLDICPDCKHNLETAGSSASFVPSPPRSSGYKTRCDLSVPWVRMAWLLVLQGKASKSLVGEVIMGIAKETPCPGRTPSVRNWRRIYDPEVKKFIPNFDACPSCVRSVETLFPNLRACFEPVPHADQSKKRVCHLTFESPRFARYIDLLDDISKQAHTYRREPNMLRFVNLARSFSDVTPCRRDDQFRGVSWHFIPHLPDFTVCDECYLDVVWPHVTRGSEIAKTFNPTMQMPHSMSAKLSCQLYSARMRELFERCCERNDLHGLRREALARVVKERELQARVEQARTLPPDWRASEMERLIGEWRQWE